MSCAPFECRPGAPESELRELAAEISPMEVAGLRRAEPANQGCTGRSRRIRTAPDRAGESGLHRTELANQDCTGRSREGEMF